jgi:hypothetical protein
MRDKYLKVQLMFLRMQWDNYFYNRFRLGMVKLILQNMINK